MVGKERGVGIVSGIASSDRLQWILDEEIDRRRRTGCGARKEKGRE